MQKKHKKLTDFAKKPAAEQAPQSKDQAVEESEVDRGEVAERAGSESEDVLREVLEVLMKKQQATAPPMKELVEEKHLEEVKEEEKGEAKAELHPIREEKLVNVAQEAFGKKEIRIIECNKYGICADGKKLSDIFEDKGLKWQRTFLNTTRLPLFLDFVAEEAEIKGRVGKALIIVSARGAQAIIPDDFLCEAVKRYGILVNTEKCVNYKTSPWAEKTRRKQR